MASGFSTRKVGREKRDVLQRWKNTNGKFVWKETIHRLIQCLAWLFKGFVPILYSYCISIVFEFYLRSICIVCALYLYLICIAFVLYLGCVCSVLVLSLCCVCTVFVLYWHCVHAVFVARVDCGCIAFAQRLYCICIVFWLLLCSFIFLLCCVWIVFCLILVVCSHCALYTPIRVRNYSPAFKGKKRFILPFLG